MSDELEKACREWCTSQLGALMTPVQVATLTAFVRSQREDAYIDGAAQVMAEAKQRIAALEAALNAADAFCEVVRTQDHGHAERERLITAHDAYLSARAKVKP